MTMSVLAIRRTFKPPRRKLFPVLAFRKVHLENVPLLRQTLAKNLISDLF